jgi:hypothetical protein
MGMGRRVRVKVNPFFVNGEDLDEVRSGEKLSRTVYCSKGDRREIRLQFCVDLIGGRVVAPPPQQFKDSYSL